MAVPSDLYCCASFLNAVRNREQIILDLVYLADVDAGTHFGAPRRVCTFLDEATVRGHPLFDPLKNALIRSWKDRMEGLEVRPVLGAGHGLFVKDAR